MSKKELVAARLELISAKSKLLAEEYKNGKMWDGDLSRGLDELVREITYVRNERGSESSGGWQDGR